MYYLAFFHGDLIQGLWTKWKCKWKTPFSYKMPLARTLNFDSVNHNKHQKNQDKTPKRFLSASAVTYKLHLAKHSRSFSSVANVTGIVGFVPILWSWEEQQDCALSHLLCHSQMKYICLILTAGQNIIVAQNCFISSPAPKVLWPILKL